MKTKFRSADNKLNKKKIKCNNHFNKQPYLGIATRIISNRFQSVNNQRNKFFKQNYQLNFCKQNQLSLINKKINIPISNKFIYVNKPFKVIL